MKTRVCIKSQENNYNTLYNVTHYIGEKERIDEQAIYLLTSILFVQHMTSFTTTTLKFTTTYLLYVP